MRIPISCVRCATALGGDTVNAHGRQQQRRRSKDSEDHQTKAVLIQG